MPPRTPTDDDIPQFRRDQIHVVAREAQQVARQLARNERETSASAATADSRSVPRRLSKFWKGLNPRSARRTQGTRTASHASDEALSDEVPRDDATALSCDSGLSQVSASSRRRQPVTPSAPPRFTERNSSDNQTGLHLPTFVQLSVGAMVTADTRQSTSAPVTSTSASMSSSNSTPQIAPLPGRNSYNTDESPYQEEMHAALCRAFDDAVRRTYSKPSRKDPKVSIPGSMPSASTRHPPPLAMDEAAAPRNEWSTKVFPFPLEQETLPVRAPAAPIAETHTATSPIGTSPPATTHTVASPIGTSPPATTPTTTTPTATTTTAATPTATTHITTTPTATTHITTTPTATTYITTTPTATPPTATQSYATSSTPPPFTSTIPTSISLTMVSATPTSPAPASPTPATSTPTSPVPTIPNPANPTSNTSSPYSARLSPGPPSPASTTLKPATLAPTISTNTSPIPSAAPPVQAPDRSVVDAALRDGKSRLDSVRLLVLGGSMRGKTSTIASVRRRAFMEKRPSTRGVQLDVCYVLPGRQNVDADEESSLRRRDKFLAKLREFSCKWEKQTVESYMSMPRTYIDSTLTRASSSLSQVKKQTTENHGSVPRTYSDSTLTLASSTFSQVKKQTVKRHRNMSRTYSDSTLPRASSALSQSEPVAAHVMQTEDEVLERVMQQAHASVVSFDDFALDAAVPLRIWDFGGQPEYAVAHGLYISPRSIFMFVFDLERFEDPETKDEEVSELSRWFQLVFALTVDNELSGSSLLIVGTRRDSCKHPELVSRYAKELRELLVNKVGTGICKKWNIEDTNCMKIIALENKIAINHVNESGLAELEENLSSIAIHVIERSPEIPLRWLAFLENLRAGNAAKGRLFLDQSYIEAEMNGFRFPLLGVKRKEELQSMLLYFRDLGEIILFSTSRKCAHAQEDHYVVFLEPEKILTALEVVIAPEDIRYEGLACKEERAMMSRGQFNMEILQRKWKHIDGLRTDHERNMLVDLLTSLDIFAKLKYTHAERQSAQEVSRNDGLLLCVPALLPSGWKDWKWLTSGADNCEVSAVTVFDDFIPFGLVGTLVARLHRTIGQGETDVRLVRADAVLLTLGHATAGQPVTQVFAGFDFDNRELHWTVRADTYEFSLLGRCLQEFEDQAQECTHLSSASSGSFRHFFVASCCTECSDLNYRLTFPVPTIPHLHATDVVDRSSSEWWGMCGASLMEVSEMCQQSICNNKNCCRCWTLQRAIETGNPSKSPGLWPQKPYIVFVSHAGEDKEWAAYLTDALERRGLRTFLDRIELQAHHMSAPERMRAAIHEAAVGVFIISADFYGKKWTVRELLLFLARKDETGDEGRRLVMFPIFDRLTFEETSNADLYDNASVAPVLQKQGFFRSERQREHGTVRVVEAFKKLCQFSGLRRGDEEMHIAAWRRNPLLYIVVYLFRIVCQMFGGDPRDWELRGMTRWQYFDCAAERIEKAYLEAKAVS